MKTKNPIKLLKRGDIWGAIVSIFIIIIGALGAIFASLGLCVACSIPIIALILSLIGIGTGFLYDYNIWVISIGVIFLGISIYFFYRKRKCKTCEIKN
jgi:LPXTG-motif cell wall-anchored protein